MYTFSKCEPDFAVQRKTFNETMFSRTRVIFALQGSGLWLRWMSQQWKTLNLQFECQLRCLCASELFGVCWSGRQDSNRPQLDCLLCIKPHRRLLEEMKRILCTFQSCSSAHLPQLLSSLACSRGLGGLLVGHNRVAVVLACSVVSFAEARSSILGRLLQTESPQSGAKYRSSCRPGRVHQLISIWMRWHSSTLRK